MENYQMQKLTIGELHGLYEAIKSISRKEDPPGTLSLSKVRMARAPRMALAMNTLAWEAQIKPYQEARNKLFHDIAPEGFNEDKTLFTFASISKDNLKHLDEAVIDLSNQEVEVAIQQIEMKDFDVSDDMPQAEYEAVLLLLRRVIKDFPDLPAPAHGAKDDKVVPIAKAS
jgi:hypothetical protein